MAQVAPKEPHEPPHAVRPGRDLTHRGRHARATARQVRALLDFCRTLAPTTTAVAHPCDESSLKGAVEAARLGLIAPILVGPARRIEAIATQCAVDVSGISIVDSAHSHDSADKAVALVREGKAEALMKGACIPTS
jgi:phosphate acetyltransferase